MMKSRTRIVTRRLRLGDIPALLDLERRQWTQDQAADAEDFRNRIDTHPALCNGAFDAETGELLASLFCKPTTDAEWVQARDWETSASLAAGKTRVSAADALFGISLTSIDARAALQVIAFQYLAAIRSGQRCVYLGSPMPGWSRHLARNPGASVENYARSTKAGLPADPQLRYYHDKGFRRIVTIRENYFPHEASGNHGAILKARVPFAWMRPLLLLLPERSLRAMSARAPRFAIPREAPDGAPRSRLAPR